MTTRSLGLALALALCGCGPNPVLLCEDIARTKCRKYYECFTSEVDRSRLDAGFHLGESSAECATEQQNLCTLRPLPDGKTTSEICDVGTDGGLRLYDTEAAVRCINEVKALKCTALRTGQFPTSCRRTCK